MSGTSERWDRRERLNHALALRLQLHANRWIPRLQAAGFEIPDEVIVYVSNNKLVIGSAGRGTNTRSATVYVKPVDPWPGHDPLWCPIAVLIHELLHHDRGLLHWQIYWLADQFHARTQRGATPMPEWISDADIARLRIPPFVITQDLAELDDGEYPDPLERPEYWGFDDDDEDEEEID